MESALTLISAPAGFGKTTLLAQWLAESGTPVAWLSLEPGDNEPIRFFSYVLAALHILHLQLGTTAHTLLETSSNVALERVLALLINDVLERATDPFALVLDNYHVIETEAIRRSDLDLILVDEGDWLNVESFEFLRHVFDRTGCPIVIVGLPSIMQVIVRHEKFVSRIGLQMEFLPLTQEEVLTTVLPALTLPYWQYHADQRALIATWALHCGNGCVRRFGNCGWSCNMPVKSLEPGKLNSLPRRSWRRPTA